MPQNDAYMYSRLLGRSGIVDVFGELQSGWRGICSIHTYFEWSNKLGYPSKLIIYIVLRDPTKILTSSSQFLTSICLSYEHCILILTWHAWLAISQADLITRTVKPRYSEPLKCGHLVLMDLLLRYGLHSFQQPYIITPECGHSAINTWTPHHSPYNVDTRMPFSACKTVRHCSSIQQLDIIITLLVEHIVKSKSMCNSHMVSIPAIWIGWRRMT